MTRKPEVPLPSKNHSDATEDLLNYKLKVARSPVMSLRVSFNATVFLCVLGTGLDLYAQPISYDEFHRQRMLEREMKSEVFARKKTADLANLQNVDQQKFDVSYYQLNLNIDPPSSLLSGFVDVQGKGLVTDLKQLHLDLAANMNVAAVSGDANSFSRQGDQLIINLTNSLAPDQQFNIRIHYHGTPTGGGFGGIVFDQQNGQPLVWTLSEPYYARSWWPCKDTPNDKADSVDVIVTVPSDLIAASNGNLIEQRENGDGTITFHWQERYAITTYLVSLAITNYVTFSQWFKYSPSDSMEIRNYVYPSQLERARKDLTPLVDMITFFHQTFGPYPFLSEKYGVAQFGWGGGMEHQTLSSQGSFGQVLTVHELAHQWWGDMITNANWSEIWLNEGFASYSEALYFENANSKEYYHQYMSWMDRQFVGSIYRTDTTSVGSIFNGIVYDKGAWVLHMLRNIVGDSTFFDILKAYAEDDRFKYKNATTLGFRDICEAVSGLDLSWFFDPWIFGTGRPNYLYSWEARKSDSSYQVDLFIEQAQVAEHQLFVMPIDVQIESANRDTTIRLFNNEAIQTFSINLPFEPNSVALDKEGWILKQVEQLPTNVNELDESPEQFTLLQNYPNPFNASTTIIFDLQKPGHVELKIYNLSGQMIRRLASDFYGAGSHRIAWRGKNDAGYSISSGVYFYQLSSGEFKKSRKLILIK